MVYSTITLIRNLSGLTTKEKTDDNLTELIDIADDVLNRYCERTTDFPIADENYKQVQLASALLVSWMGLRSLLGSEQKAKEMRDEAYRILDNIRSGSSGAML